MNCASCANLASTEPNVCKGCGPFYNLWKPLFMSPSQKESSTQLTQVGGTHYLREIQPFDIVKAWDLGFFRGNVVKYVLRCTAKNEKEDLLKARHYLDHCIENYDALNALGAF